MKMTKKQVTNDFTMTDACRVRIVSNATVYRCEVLGDMNEHREFLPLIELLETASSNDTIILELGGPGGDFDVGSLLVRAIMNSAAFVVAEVILPCASMSAMLALTCGALRMNKGTYLMFHAYTAGFKGKAGDLVQQVENEHCQTQRLMDDWLQPFLSKKEVAKMWEGKDIYIHDDDSTLIERCQRHFGQEDIEC